MSRKGPPQQFFQRQASSPDRPRIVVPRGRPASTASGGKKPQGKGGAGKPAGTEGGISTTRSMIGNREEWKTYVVIGATVIILAAISFTFIRRTFHSLDRTQALEEMAALAGILSRMDKDLAETAAGGGEGGSQGGGSEGVAASSGLRLAPAMRNDAVLLEALAYYAAGGEAQRGEAGEVVGVNSPAKGAKPRYLVPLRRKSSIGPPFQFRFSTDEKQRFPAIAVEGLGALSPPEPGSGGPVRWIFDGDLSRIPHDSVIGGYEVPVRLRRGDGTFDVINVFGPSKHSDDPSPGEKAGS